MNPDLYRKIVELKLMTPGTQIAIEYPVYENLKKVKTIKGHYKVLSLFSSALIPGTFIQAEANGEELTLSPIHIKLIDGKTPVKLASEYGIRADGKTNDAPKRRGRRPKVRTVEEEWVADALDDEDDEDEDLELTAEV